TAPASSGGNGGYTPTPRTARTSPSTATASPAAITARKAGRQSRTVASTSAPRLPPAAKAPRTLRPARPRRRAGVRSGDGGLSAVGGRATGGGWAWSAAVGSAPAGPAGWGRVPPARSLAGAPALSLLSGGGIRPRAARLPCA